MVLGLLSHVLREILAFVDLSWADDQNNSRSSLAYYRKLFPNHTTFSWRATPSQSVELSTAEAELMALAVAVVGKSCGLVSLQSSWASHSSNPPRRGNVVYWNPNGISSMISCAIKSFKRHSQGMSFFMVCVFVF